MTWPAPDPNNPPQDLADATLMQLCNSFVAAVMEGEGDWTDALDKLNKAIDGKVERYQRAAHFIRAKRAAIVGEATFYSGLVKKLMEKAQVLSNQDDRMEQALLNMMHETGKTVIETNLGTLRIKKTPHIELDQSLIEAKQIVDMMPEKYLRYYDPEVDKKELLNDYRALVKALRESLSEDEAIEAARKKMPTGVNVVYNEGVGGY